MTFGVALLVADGVVALADTRVVRGEQHSTKAKLATIRHNGGTAVVMTSGLRSVRDKVMLRLEDDLDENPAAHRRLHELVTAFGDHLKRVRTEDAEALAEADLTFNLHAIIGGQLPGDREPQLFLVYPEGNWIAATSDLPYFMIGRTFYGKPILDRLARHDTPLIDAVALAYLAFDATEASVVDVGFPIDVIALTSEGGLRERRYDADDLAEAHAYWQEQLATALAGMPRQWASGLRQEMEPGP